LYQFTFIIDGKEKLACRTDGYVLNERIDWKSMDGCDRDKVVPTVVMALG